MRGEKCRRGKVWEFSGITTERARTWGTRLTLPARLCVPSQCYILGVSRRALYLVLKPAIAPLLLIPFPHRSEP